MYVCENIVAQPQHCFYDFLMAPKMDQVANWLYNKILQSMLRLDVGGCIMIIKVSVPWTFWPNQFPTTFQLL